MDMNFEWHTRTEKLIVVEYWWREQKGLCCICNGLMEPYHRDAGTNPNAASVEHLVPKRDNGPDAVWNVRLAHRSCNNRAGGQWAYEEHCRLVAEGLVRPKRRKSKRPAYVYDDRNAQDPATGQPFTGLDKRLVSLPRGATLMPFYKGRADYQPPVAKKMTAAETAAWLRKQGVRGS
jgi:hypothetical protein